MSVLSEISAWFYTGHSLRVPDEDRAPWSTLLADDLAQITRTDSTYRASLQGPVGPLEGWRPWRAFSPTMVRTGPTPAVRQAILRPLRYVKSI